MRMGKCRCEASPIFVGPFRVQLLAMGIRMIRVLQIDAMETLDIAGAIRNGLRDNELIAVRNLWGLKGALSPYEYTNLMTQVGRLWTTDDELAAESKFQLPNYPGIIELSDDGLLGDKKLPPHSDASHHPARPYPCRSLLPTVLPPDGSGQTTWYSMYDVAEMMDGFLSMGPRYDQVVCWHQAAYGTGWPGRWAPLVEVDPWSGRRYISYSKLFVRHHSRRIKDCNGYDQLVPLGDDEIVNLQREIEACVDISRSYTHNWSLGDLLVWNNSGTAHSRTAIGSGHSRRMWRITFDLVW